MVCSLFLVFFAKDAGGKPNQDTIQRALDEAQRPDAEVGEGNVDEELAKAAKPDVTEAAPDQAPPDQSSSQQHSSQGVLSTSSGSDSSAKENSVRKVAKPQGPDEPGPPKKKASEKTGDKVDAKQKPKAPAVDVPKASGRGRGAGAKKRAVEPMDEPEPASSSCRPKSSAAKAKPSTGDASRLSSCNIIVRMLLHMSAGTPCAVFCPRQAKEEVIRCVFSCRSTKWVWPCPIHPRQQCKQSSLEA